MADAATVLLVMSCRVFEAGKVDELGDVVGPGVVAGKVRSRQGKRPQSVRREHTGSDMVFGALDHFAGERLPAHLCLAYSTPVTSVALDCVYRTANQTKRLAPTLE